MARSISASITTLRGVRAIRRHLEGKEPRGITAEDLDEAVKETPAQIKSLAHGDELSAIEGEFGGRENIRKLEPV